MKLRQIFLAAFICCFFSCHHFKSIGREESYYYSGNGELFIHPDKSYQVNLSSGLNRPYALIDSGRVEIRQGIIYFNSVYREKTAQTDTTTSDYIYSPYFENYIADTTEVLLHNSKITHTIYHINLYKGAGFAYHLDSLPPGGKTYVKIPNANNSEKILLSMGGLSKSFRPGKDIKLRFYIDTLSLTGSCLKRGAIGRHKITIGTKEHDIIFQKRSRAVKR